MREGLGKRGSAPCRILSGSRAQAEVISQCDPGGKAGPKLKLSLAKGQQAQPSQEKAAWASRGLARCSCSPALSCGSWGVVICQRGHSVALPDADVAWNCSWSTGHRGRAARAGLAPGCRAAVLPQGLLLGVGGCPGLASDCGGRGGGEEIMPRGSFERKGLPLFKSLKSKGAEGLSFLSALTSPNSTICLAGLLHLKSPHRALFPWP